MCDVAFDGVHPRLARVTGPHDLLKGDEEDAAAGRDANAGFWALLADVVDVVRRVEGLDINRKAVPSGHPHAIEDLVFHDRSGGSSLLMQPAMGARSIRKVNSRAVGRMESPVLSSFKGSAGCGDERSFKTNEDGLGHGGRPLAVSP